MKKPILACALHDELELLALSGEEVRLTWYDGTQWQKLTDRIRTFQSQDGVETLIGESGASIPTNILLSANEHILSRPFREKRETLAEALRNQRDLAPIMIGLSEAVTMDLSPANVSLADLNLNDQVAFQSFVDEQRKGKPGIGGYGEFRKLYARESELFGEEEELRNIHLGIDFWQEAGSAIMAPLDGIVVIASDNQGIANYGPTVVLQHEVEGLKLFSLYGHLSRETLNDLNVGQPILQGQEFARLGAWPENGNWPPHLHFQLMIDLLGNKMDFPGVCHSYDRPFFLDVCPDPNLVLRGLAM